MDFLAFKNDTRAKANQKQYFNKFDQFIVFILFFKSVVHRHSTKKLQSINIRLWVSQFVRSKFPNQNITLIIIELENVY